MAKKKTKNQKLSAAERPLFSAPMGYHHTRTKDVVKRSSRQAKHKNKLPEFNRS